MHNVNIACRANEKLVRLVRPTGTGAVMIEAKTALVKLQAISKAPAFNEWLGKGWKAASHDKEG
jgi:hypothetical protein